MEEFDRKFSIEILETAFDTLRATFLREHTKSIMISLKRKIAEQRLEILRMLFFKNELKTSKKVFTSEKRETLITFYQTNPALWNLKKMTVELYCISPSQRALINSVPHNQIQVNQRKVKIVSRNKQTSLGRQQLIICHNVIQKTGH